MLNSDMATRSQASVVLGPDVTGFAVDLVLLSLDLSSLTGSGFGRDIVELPFCEMPVCTVLPKKGKCTSGHFGVI
jgi:hypothetical protein